MNKSLRDIIHVYCRINGFFLTLFVGVYHFCIQSVSLILSLALVAHHSWFVPCAPAFQVASGMGYSITKVEVVSDFRTVSGHLSVVADHNGF